MSLKQACTEIITTVEKSEDDYIGVDINMTDYRFFERKFRILESFYMWIEQGSDYNVAFGQCEYYDTQENELDDILILITQVSHFRK